jgi:hypothetical protein
MAGPYKYSPSAGSKIEIQINANYVPIAGCEAIPEFGAEKGTYEVTAINDVAKYFGDDLPDYGEITLTGTADTTDPGQARLMSSSGTAGVVDSLRATFAKPPSGTAGAIGTFSGLVLSYKLAATKGKAQTFQSKVKLTGAVNWTAAA